MPSKEAMDAAEKLVRMEVAHETPDCTLVVAGVELYSVNASQGPMSEMYDTVCELQAGIATALDAHTADLQSEVEALRARVAELEAPLSEEITVVEARMEAQRKRLMRHRIQSDIKKTRDSLDY